MAAGSPAEIGQVEDLYLTGLHLEQYRHATFNPIDYYAEGLRLSPEDIRCNNAMGLLLLRRGQFAKAEPYLRRAVASITRRNPNPYDGEPYYNFGWALKLQGRLDDAVAKCTEGLAVHQEVGSRPGEAQIISDLAALRLTTPSLARARDRAVTTSKAVQASVRTRADASAAMPKKWGGVQKDLATAMDGLVVTLPDTQT